MSVWQSLTMTSRSIGSLRPLDERPQPDTHVRATAAIQFDLPRREHLSARRAPRHRSTRRRRQRRSQSWRVRPRQFGERSRQLRILHRAGGVDQKPRPRSRLVEAGHEELAVAGLPAVRPPVGAVVSAERALAQGSAHDVADGRHVVDLRRERRAGPATPRRSHVTCEERGLVDTPCHLARARARPSSRSTPGTPPLALIVARQLPESPFAVRARSAILRTTAAMSAAACSTSRPFPALQTVLDGQAADRPAAAVPRRGGRR